MKPIVCPHCGNSDQFYMRYSYKDVIGVIDNQGNYGEEIFDGAWMEGGKVIYCYECGKQVMRTSTLDKLKKD